MADEGFDPCECIWNHQSAMRRLVALLRSSQSYCTDNECIDELPGPQGSTESNTLLMTFMALAMAFLLIAFRPQSLQNPAQARKQRDSEPDDSAPPPLC